MADEAIRGGTATHRDVVELASYVFWKGEEYAAALTDAYRARAGRDQRRLPRPGRHPAVVLPRGTGPDQRPAGHPGRAPLRGQPDRHARGRGPEAAAQIARRVHGGILELRPEERAQLVGTVEVSFATGGSADATGAPLFCHPTPCGTGYAGWPSTPGATCAIPPRWPS